MQLDTQQRCQQLKTPCFLPQLRFQPSQSKNKLYLGNIPKDMMKDAIHAKLDEHIKGSYFARSLLLPDITAAQSLTLVSILLQ